MYEVQDFLESGGVMSYGVNVAEIQRRAAGYVDIKILKGGKPADLPIEQPTKFDLVINLKTANALGLTVPQSLLVRADEIMQSVTILFPWLARNLPSRFPQSL